MCPNLVNSEGDDFQVTLSGNVTAGEGLVVCDPKRWIGLVEMQMKPIDTRIQVAAKHQRDHRGGEDPVVTKHRNVVRNNESPGQSIQSISANITPGHSHHLQKSKEWTLKKQTKTKQNKNQKEIEKEKEIKD